MEGLLQWGIMNDKKLLEKAYQLAQRCTDWNLDEVEIDGEMVSVYDLADEFKTAIKANDALLYLKEKRIVFEPPEISVNKETDRVYMKIEDEWVELHE